VTSTEVTPISAATGKAGARIDAGRWINMLAVTPDGASGDHVQRLTSFDRDRAVRSLGIAG
jgi:hypothetical protein